MTSSDASRERYETILDVVEYNTGGPNQSSPQPPGMTTAAIAGHVARSTVDADLDDVQATLQAAVSNGDLLRYPDAAGQIRFARATEAGLRAVIGAENGRDEPRVELIEHVAGLLEEVEQ